MFGPESHLDSKFSVKMPNMPNIQTPSAPNPFQGIRRAGQAKRAQNYEKFIQQGGPQSGFSGQKNQNMGGQAGTLSGNMQQNRPEKFS